MRIKRENISDFYSENRGYNLAVRAVVQNILQHQDVRPLGYRPSRDIPKQALLRPSKRARRVTQAPSQTAQEVDRFDIRDLSPYERVIFACCAWGDYSTYVLTGEMGSGKTAVARFMRSVLRRPRTRLCAHCSSCKPTVIYRDFNAYAHVGSIHDLQMIFKEDLLAALLPVVVEIFSETSRVDTFRKYLRESADDDDLVRFLDFDAAARATEGWYEFTEAQKAEALADYVRCRPAAIAPEQRSIDAQLLYCTTLLSYIRQRIRHDPACFVFIFDNIDGVRPDGQLSLLHVILALQATAAVRALVPLRLTTFERWESQAAFVFGHIDHIGPGAMDIVRQRLQWWLAHWDEQPEVQEVDYRYRVALRQRLEYLFEVFTNSPRTVEQLAALAGASVRLGLFLMERVFMNGVVRYDQNPYYVDEVVRCVLVDSANDTLDISLDDQYTANLFADPETNEFSLVTLRLLQLTYSLRLNVSERTVGNVTRTIAALHPAYTSEKIRLSLNQLLFEKSPLLWIEARASFSDDEHLLERNEVMSTTEAGGLYIETLLANLVYIQETFMSVSWPDERVPAQVDYSRVAERFAALHACLECVLERDREEVARYLVARRDGSVKLRLDVELVSNRVLATVARPLLGILKTRETSLKASVLRAWQSLLITGFNNEWDLLQRENSRLAGLSKEFAETAASAPQTVHDRKAT